MIALSRKKSPPKEKMVKCRYSHCNQPENIRPVSEMIVVGRNSYYHPRCYEEKETIAKIIDYYLNSVDSRVTVAQLRNVINNIIFKKGVPAEELLFDLMYVNNAGRKINSPYTLHYIITNKKVQHEYKKHKESSTPKIDTSKVQVKEEVEIVHNNKAAKGFDTII